MIHTWGSGRFSGDATHLADQIAARLRLAVPAPKTAALNELALGS